jgi:thioredoxin 1
MSDASDPDDIESIREPKKEELLSRAGSPDEPIHVEDTAHFEESIADHRAVLVDFYADWRGPCKMLEPVVGLVTTTDAFEVIAGELEDPMDVAAEDRQAGVPPDGEQLYAPAATARICLPPWSTWPLRGCSRPRSWASTSTGGRSRWSWR